MTLPESPMPALGRSPLMRTTMKTRFVKASQAQAPLRSPFVYCKPLNLALACQRPSYISVVPRVNHLQRAKTDQWGN